MDATLQRSGRNAQGLVAGALIGTLGGRIGLGGAEFRLPVLVGLFRLKTLDAVVLNKAMSLVVVASALLFRGSAITPALLVGFMRYARTQTFAVVRQELPLMRWMTAGSILGGALGGLALGLVPTRALMLLLGVLLLVSAVKTFKHTP